MMNHPSLSYTPAHRQSSRVAEYTMNLLISCPNPTPPHWRQCRDKTGTRRTFFAELRCLPKRLLFPDWTRLLKTMLGPRKLLAVRPEPACPWCAPRRAPAGAAASGVLRRVDQPTPAPVHRPPRALSATASDLAYSTQAAHGERERPSRPPNSSQSPYSRSPCFLLTPTLGSAAWRLETIHNRVYCTCAALGVTWLAGTE